MSLYRIEDFETLSKTILRWVSYQRRDPEQAINSICAELGDPRRLPMAIEKLTSEASITRKELDILIKALGKFNLRALSYLLRADLKVNYNRYKALRSRIDSRIEQIIKTTTDLKVEDVTNKLVQEEKETVTEIATLLNCEIDEIKRRIEAWMRRKLEE
jgi:transcriptional regulator of heat shock response